MLAILVLTILMTQRAKIVYRFNSTLQTSHIQGGVKRYLEVRGGKRLSRIQHAAILALFLTPPCFLELRLLPSQLRFSHLYQPEIHHPGTRKPWAKQPNPRRDW